MTTKHTLLSSYDPVTGTASHTLRRWYEDGKTIPCADWCGRNHGWQYIGDGRLAPKRYARADSALRALATILRHERELGIHGRISWRY